MELDRAIKGRHSVRKFSDKKPNWRTIIECIDAARFAPTAGNNYTLKFMMVDNEEKIKKLAQAAQQRHVGEVKYVVVVFSDPSRPVNLYEKSGEIFCRQQAGAAIQNFLLKIEESGLATCWIGYFIEEQVKKILKIPAKYQIEALFPIGFEHSKPKTKRQKIELDRILYFNEYDNKKMKTPKAADT